jgi:hypothetical protein
MMETPPYARAEQGQIFGMTVACIAGGPERYCTSSFVCCPIVGDKPA